MRVSVKRYAGSQKKWPQSRVAINEWCRSINRLMLYCSTCKRIEARSMQKAYHKLWLRTWEHSFYSIKGFLHFQPAINAILCLILRKLDFNLGFFINKAKNLAMIGLCNVQSAICHDFVSEKKEFIDKMLKKHSPYDYVWPLVKFTYTQIWMKMRRTSKLFVRHK